MTVYEDLEEEEIRDENEDGGLFEHFRFTADKGQSPIRVDVFLQDRIENISRNRIQQAAKAGSVLVNGQPVKSNYKVKPADVIQIVYARPVTEHTVEAEDLNLEIVYEDDDVVLINKRAGMVVHPGHGNFSGTLVNGLMHLHANWPEINGATRPGIVHRLDKNTSGLIIAGKTEWALQHLAKQFFDRTIKRHYIALVWGDVEADKGRVEGNIVRNPNNRKLFQVDPDGLTGKWAATNYEVLQRFGYVSLLRCQLETGRTHQIRVHLKYIGHTLFNDFNYGGDQILAGTVYSKYKQFIQNCFTLLPYHALHAQSLGFTHPTTLKEMYFEAPLPDNFQAVIDKWETYTKGFQIKGFPQENEEEIEEIL
jgi:23S rRNA pseudouridine1911/1915/1917 synthase